MTSPNPAPYFIDEARAAICTRCPRTGETLTLCMFTGWGESDRAMARVMVAAHDLMDALKAVLFAQQHLLGQFDEYDLAATEEARAAIAKAEGRA